MAEISHRNYVHNIFFSEITHVYCINVRIAVAVICITQIISMSKLTKFGFGQGTLGNLTP